MVTLVIESEVIFKVGPEIKIVELDRDNYGVVVNGIVVDSGFALYEVEALMRQIELISYDDLQTIFTFLTQTYTDVWSEASTSELDPTVQAWAKQPTKPSYTADEVGAMSTGAKTWNDLMGN